MYVGLVVYTHVAQVVQSRSNSPCWMTRNRQINIKLQVDSGRCQFVGLMKGYYKQFSE